MQSRDGALQLSATDLANFLSCRHRTALDMAVAAGKRKPPTHSEDTLLQLLFDRGIAHEKEYVDWLKAQGHNVADLSAINSMTEADTDHTRSRLGTRALLRRDAARRGRQDVARRSVAAEAMPRFNDGCWCIASPTVRSVDGRLSATGNVTPTTTSHSLPSKAHYPCNKTMTD
jgi:hypothetical protein